jgi:hypothetical protein
LGGGIICGLRMRGMRRKPPSEALDRGNSKARCGGNIPDIPALSTQLLRESALG